MDTIKKEDSAAKKGGQKFAYYPGCSLNSTAIDFNVSVKNLLKVLGIHFEEITDWNCCGTTPAHNVSKEMPVALSARNLFLAKKMGLDEIISPCVSCYCKLSKASNIINNKENKSESELKTEKEILELFQSMGFKTEDEFNFKIYSLVELLYKNTELIRQKFIESKNKNSIRSGTETIESKILADLKPVCYYGCVLLRTEGVTRFDNMENPTSMEEILDCVGIKSRHFRFKTECCGAILSLTHKKIVLKLSKEILDASIEAGANSIVVCCPLCQQNLDLRQSQINKYYKTNYHIPVYYISQILGLAMGLSYRDVMIDRLFVEPEFLKK